MDAKLLSWGLAVKSRRRQAGLRGPVLWLFTDAVRLADPRLAVARLPKGLCGVVLRHDADPYRAALARDLAALCRARRLALVIAGDWRLAHHWRAGLHLRDARGQPRRSEKLLTSSAHGRAALHRAARLGCDIVFLSPLFATASHPGAPFLGSRRWANLARHGVGSVVALGGIDRSSARRVPRMAAGVAGIGGFS